ncbi:MAG TPA: hypothetical protein VLW49_06390 [Gaiellaceae bacterium]|nr:hypothetical protein [Gaiellaceae bacterium]
MRLAHQAFWSFTLYPQAAEGGGCFVPTLPRRAGGGDGGADSERSQEEAARRARAKVRRFCAANRLNRLGTLTYAGEGCFDPVRLRVELGDFFRGLRRELGGKPIPYLWVPEWHPGGHGLHAHFAVGRYVPVGLVKDVWGRGIVHIKLIGDLPVGSGSLEEARTVARYLSPYVSKGFAGERVPGLHRYEVAQGFQPGRVPLRGESDLAVMAEASGLMGSEPARIWRSSETEGWRGPPAYWCAWAGR